MKITSIYTSRNISFGYDKKLNSELKQRLSSHTDKEWAQDLLSLNNYVNRLENRVSKTEQGTDTDSEAKHQDYLDLFLTLKESLAAFVSVTFSDLNYADREFNHYHDKYVKSGAVEDDWRIDACEALKEWVSPDLIKKLGKKSSDDLKNPEQTLELQPSVGTKQKPSQKVQDIVNKITGGVSPQSLLEVYNPSPQSPKGFSDVAGMSDLKRDLSEGIIQLIQNPEQAKLDFEDYGKTIPKSILLYGPPGCGKTYITQALAAETESPLYLLNISKAGSHYINMTSKNIQAAFDEMISIADKSDKPCLLFMDEIDTMAFDRNSRMEPDDLKQVGTILQAMDAAKAHNIIIIGATNKYNILDPAVKRRFDSKVFVDVPDDKSINALLKKNLTPLRKGQALLASEDDIDKISKMLKGYSNSSICNISKEAAMNALRRNRADISLEDYKYAIENTGEEKPDRKEYLADSKKISNKIGFSA